VSISLVVLHFRFLKHSILMKIWGSWSMWVHTISRQWVLLLGPTINQILLKDFNRKSPPPGENDMESVFLRTSNGGLSLCADE
jgi:hypothetical protein